MKEQPAGIGHTAQMIKMALRTGLSERAAGNATASFRDVMQMAPEEASAALQAAPTGRQRAVQFSWVPQIRGLFAARGRGVSVYPYVRLRGYKGTYLYFLARLLQ